LTQACCEEYRTKRVVRIELLSELSGMIERVRRASVELEKIINLFVQKIEDI
jgi:hypothetical protein